MARREVSADEVSFDGSFLKLQEVFPEPTSEFQGVYISDDEGQYGQNYKFRLNKTDRERFECDDGIGILSVKGPLKAQLAKLKPAPGELVTIERRQNKGEFWTFQVYAEPGPKGAASKPPPPSKPEADDWA